MKRATAMARVFLLVLTLLGMTLIGTGWAQPKTELTIALSSFATEVLDPALGGHLVKYYLSMMFDYLVGHDPRRPALPRRRHRHPLGELGRTTSAGPSTSARASSSTTATT